MQIVDDDKEEYTVHFAALFSEKRDAVPIALFHGWPGKRPSIAVYYKHCHLKLNTP